MIIAGIDIGTDYTQAAIIDDEELVGTGETRSGFDLDEAVEESIEAALDEADLSMDDIDVRVATGEGRKNVGVDEQVTSYRAIATSLARTDENARTALLMGAKNAAALKLDGEGNVLDFDENDKCAAGVGRFLSDLTRFVDMELDEMIEATLETDRGVDELNTQCSVFAESEVISLIHEDVSEARIARGVHEAIAERNSSLIRRVGLEEDVYVVGGVGRNEAFLKALESSIDTEVFVPEHPAHVAAHGAALLQVADLDAEIEADAEPGDKKADGPIGQGDD